MASTSSPTQDYRAQNGIAYTPPAGADPQVVDWVRQAASETGADPVALLATSLQENGGRLGGKPGDNGTSFGPFQFHIGGALGSHPPAWASTYAAVLNRAQEFARLKVRGGTGAAAVQRPRDPALYARGVDSQLAAARKLLGEIKAGAASKPRIQSGGATTPSAPTTPAADDSSDIGQVILNAIRENSQLAKLPGSSSIRNDLPDTSLAQSLLNQNAALAGVSAPTLPAAGDATATPPATPAPGVSQSVRTQTVVPGKPKLIGFPYQGTHKLYGNWESDNAVDIALPIGTPIRAPANGVIGSQIGSLGSSDPKLAGLRVHLKTGGNEMFFQHLSRLAVKAGQHVKAGQIIGWSGEANGTAHLHLAVKRGDPRRFA